MSDTKNPNYNFESQSNWRILNSIIQGLCSKLSPTNTVNINSERLGEVFSEAETILTQNCHALKPSIFKRSAAFIIAYMAQSPLLHPFSGKGDLYKIANHQNAIVAFEFVRLILHTATIEPSEGSVRTLNNKIVVSAHLYTDIIHMLAHLPKHENCFNGLALLVETLAYTTNPDAQDKPRF